jgi:hypothetical protein
LKPLCGEQIPAGFSYPANRNVGCIGEAQPQSPRSFTIWIFCFSSRPPSHIPGGGDSYYDARWDEAPPSHLPGGGDSHYDELWVDLDPGMVGADGYIDPTAPARAGEVARLKALAYENEMNAALGQFGQSRGLDAMDRQQIRAAKRRDAAIQAAKQNRQFAPSPANMDDGSYDRKELARALANPEKKFSPQQLTKHLFRLAHAKDLSKDVAIYNLREARQANLDLPLFSPEANSIRHGWFALYTRANVEGFVSPDHGAVQPLTELAFGAPGGSIGKLSGGRSAPVTGSTQTLRSNRTAVAVLSPEARSLLKVANSPFKDQALSNAGRAATKHPEYFGFSDTQELRATYRTDDQLNKLAAGHVKEVLMGGIRSSGAGGRYPNGWITFTLPDGRAASWHASGEFIGFRGVRK